MSTMTALLAKCKERKATVVAALTAAAAVVIRTTAIDKLADSIAGALVDKNPFVKQECCSVLAAAVESGRVTLTKPFIKAVCPSIVKCLAESQPTLRDAAVVALAAFLNAAGEKAVGPSLDKADAGRAAKVREMAAAGGSSAADSGPATSSKRPATSMTRPKTSAVSSRPSTARPKTAPTKRTTVKKTAPSASGTATSKAKKGYSSEIAEITFPNMPLEEASDAIEARFDSSKQALLADPNWKERLAAATDLETVVSSLAGIEPREAFGYVKVLEQKTKLWKDTNFQVMAKVFNIVAAVANGSDTSFPDRAASIVIPGLVAKLSDSKVQPHAVACVMSLCEAWTVNDICLLTFAAAEAHRTPKVKEEAAKLTVSIVEQFGFRLAAKPAVSFAKHVLSQTSPTVRAAGVELATILYQAAGASIKAQFASEKMADKLNDQFAQVEGQPLQPASRFERVAQGSLNGSTQSVSDGRLGSPGAATQSHLDDNDDNLPRVDLNVPETVLEKLPDSNWKLRAEGLAEVSNIVKTAGAITPNLGDLLPALALRLRDTNRNLVLTTLEILRDIAEAMGSPMKRHFPVIVEGVLHALTESKDMIRSAAIEVLDAVHLRNGVMLFVDNEKMVAGLTSGKPHQQCGLLSWYRAKICDLSPGTAGLKPIVKPTFSCLSDRSQLVRQEANLLLEALISVVGPSKLKPMTSGLSGATKTAVLELLGKAAPVGSGSKSVASLKRPKTAGSATTTVKATSSRSGPSKAASTSTKSRTREEEVEAPSMLMDTKGKTRRQKEERNNKALKWSFATPREEFLNQLQDQFSKHPAANPALLTLLFNKDFKQHVKALDALIGAVQESQDEIFASSDILLQWITLRFFDTNPAVLLKSIIFCQELFSQMDAHGIELTDQEAGSFLPYLVNMSGSKLESIRQDTHILFRAICKTYPSSKVFQYLLEGLKSKNSKQRTELVCEISYMIERQGMSVCQAGAAKSLKVIGAQIADRDKGARSAALDCIVTVWNIIGNDVYKLLGDVDDKSMSLVLERVKRSGKRTDSVPSTSRPATAKGQHVARRPTSPKKASPKKSQSDVKQEFVLNLEGLNMPHLNVDDLQLAPTEIEFDDTPIDISRSPVPIAPKPSLSSSLPRPPNQFAKDLQNAEADGGNAAVEHMVEKLTNKAPLVVIDALKTAETMIRGSDSFLSQNANAILSACTTQARILFDVHLAATSKDRLTDGVRLCKHLLGFVLQSFRNSDVAKEVSPSVISTMIADLLQHVQSPKLQDLDEGQQITKALQTILLKILQTIDQNLAFSSLLQILSGALSAANMNEKHVQLVQRCLWKLVKSIPGNIETIDSEMLLESVATFFTSHPIQFTADGTEDIPTRTLRTIVQAVVKEKGLSIQENIHVLGLDPYRTPAGSMVLQALAKTGVPPEELEELRNTPVSQSRGAQSPSNSVPSESPVAMQTVPLTAQEQDQRLVQIFAMITSKEESKQGIEELGEFMEEYPNTNINKFLMTTSTFFQNHIKRSLADFKRTRSKAEPSKKNPSAPKTAAAYLDRLRKMTTHDKENTVNSSTSLQVDAFTARSETPPLPQVAHAAEEMSKPASPPKMAGGDQLAALKARLAKFHRK